MGTEPEAVPRNGTRSRQVRQCDIKLMNKIVSNFIEMIY